MNQLASSTIAILVIIVAAMIVGSEAEKKTDVDFYQDKGHKGTKKTVSVTQGQCHNLDGFDKKASSINTHGSCVYVYDDLNCKGNWIQLSPATSSHDDLRNFNFNDKISSVQFCSNVEDNVSPSRWVPTYRFDTLAECYPALPSTNGKCTKNFDKNAPIYFEGHDCDKEKLYRLQYWLFYGLQEGCEQIKVPFSSKVLASTGGKHDNDWEHVTLNFKMYDGVWCISSITYSQHSGWYTRPYRGSLPVHVGRIAHGNFHDSCCEIPKVCDSNCVGGPTQIFGVQCLYYTDLRGPGTKWTPTNIRPIKEAENQNEKIKTHFMRDICSKEKCRNVELKEIPKVGNPFKGENIIDFARSAVKAVKTEAENLISKFVEDIGCKKNVGEI